MFNLKMGKVVLSQLGLLSRYSMIKYREDWPVPVVRYPNEVVAQTVMGGVCATDLHMAALDMSFFASILANPNSLFPMGHEVVARVTDTGSEVNHLHEGDRVVLLPFPSCEALGFEPCPSCRTGNPQNCWTIAGVGDGSDKENRYGGPGAFGGAAGGGFCEYIRAFEKQLFKVPDEIPDEIAVLTEPFAVAVHAAIRNMPNNDQSVVVIGMGIIGLLVVAALRTLGSKARVTAIAKYGFQAEAARTVGADEVIVEGDRARMYERVADLTDGRLFEPIMSKKAVFGASGPDVIFDAVGTETSIEDAIHLVRSNGTIVILGQSYTVTKHVDWSIQTYKEIQIVGALTYGIEEFEGRRLHCFDLALELMGKDLERFRPLVSHTYPIDRYKKALRDVTKKRQNPVIKAAFDYR